MATVRVRGAYPGTVHEAERCWYDTAGWDQWVDELSRVVSVDGPWPRPGSSVSWESGPAGRGRVTERVLAHESLDGQTVEVQDDSITGEQTVEFVPQGDQVEVVLELRYRINSRNPFSSLIDLLFVRRLMAASLSRTLVRFGHALAASRQAAGG